MGIDIDQGIGPDRRDRESGTYSAFRELITTFQQTTMPGILPRITPVRHVILLFMCLFTVLPFSADGAEPPQKGHILVLNSYHPGYVWSDSIMEGLLDSLDDSQTTIDMHIEYMDTKYHQGDDYLEQLRSLYRHKYAHLDFDLIAACDDNAVEFLISHKDDLFPNTPVVFCGVNDNQAMARAIQVGMKGIYEPWRYSENIDLALKLFPETTTVAVIADQTPTGQGALARIEELEPDYADRIDFLRVSSRSIEQIKQDLAALPRQSIVLFTVLFATNEDYRHSSRYGAEQITDITDKPIFVITDYSVVPGVIGGYVVSGYRQGSSLGDLIQQIVIDERPLAEIQPSRTIETKFFDHKGLERFAIRPSRLPEGSVILNRPFSFYETYKVWIWILVVFLSLETLLIVLFALNRTYLKRAQIKVSQAGERLDLAIRGTEQALFYWDALNNAVTFKYLWKDILGYDQELEPLSIEEWHTHVHPDDLHQLESARMAHLQGKSPYYEQEFRVRKADGTWRWLVVKGKIMEKDRSGTPLQVTGTLRDITERKLVEEKQQRLVAALEQSEEAIAICDIQGNILPINHAFARFYHVQPAVVRSTPIWDIDRIFKIEPMWTSLEQNNAWRERIRHTVDEKKTYDLEIKASPIKDAQGRTVCYIFSHRDITRETELETQLRQAQKMQAIGQLAGGIAHDFNNLLQVILGYTSKILDDPTVAVDTRKRLETISDASKKAANLVRQLLIFSRRDMVAQQPVNANTVISDVLGLLKRTIGEQITIDYAPEPFLPLIKADAGQMHQIMMNLCVNARDAMPQGGTIFIRTSHVCLVDHFVRNHSWARKGSYVRIEVRDTGIGIPPEIREHIFEPFFTTKKLGKGTGLGLATVYGIVKSHAGLIYVDTTSDKGSSFQVYLPITEEQEKDVEPSANTSCEIPTCPATILMAEDDDMVRSLALEVLEDAGYTVIEAVNGEEAVELFMANRDSIDLVLLDVIMPKMSGQQAWEKIHELNPDLPVIFSSGYSFNELKKNTLITEKGRLIQKPYTPDQLMDTIAKTLALTSSRYIP
jgi:PAS domain S-box-containing protein